MNLQASDISAKLLATENLTVVREATRTASFDIATRVLTIPLWKDMTPEIENMLVGHEVGHALYTGEAYVKPIQEKPKLMSYMNILEDVRIEKLIKRKYPGLRKHMNEGYRQLNDRDFFGVKSVQSFDNLLLIDKINLYFKAGFQCGVKFTPEEKVFVNRAERTETIDEVIKLAEDIFEFSKQKAEEEKKKQASKPKQSEPADEEDEEEYTDDDADPDYDETPPEEKQEASDGGTKQETEVPDEDLESKTEQAFQRQLGDMADTSTKYKYWTLSNEYPEDPVVSYKEILAETLSPADWDKSDRDPKKYHHDQTRYIQLEKLQAKDFEQFTVESTRVVSYLVKEFEMRKSAQLNKRALQSKVGSLNMGKIYAYKLQDDLFKRVTILPEGKNHGMVMLLDWSGSMNNVIRDTLKQVINLVMFCQRVQIPFRVLAFSSEYDKKNRTAEDRQRLHDYAIKMRKNPDVIDVSTSFTMLELYSDKMSKSEFRAMNQRLLDYRFFYNKGYGLGGTPLSNALAYCFNTLGDYIRKHNLEKTTFITLTDGEGSYIGGGQMRESEVVYDPSYKRVKIQNYLRDPITKKSYWISAQDATQQTEVILRMIKERHNVTVVGFFICENRRRALENAIRANLPNFDGKVDELIEQWRGSFREDGFASVKNTGRDDLFLVPQSSTVIVDEDLSVDSSASSRSIAKTFGKYLNTKKNSRILLSRFVKMIA
jgi:hypothetical protein